MRLLRLLATLATLLVPMPTPADAAAPAAPERSPNVAAVGHLDEPEAISARVRGDVLYVSSLRGIAIYDVRAPRTPVPLGRLALPNAQNEDVDVGDGILLVSDDPYGGRGVVSVVDVRDPRAPRVLSTYSTWRRGLLSEVIDGTGERPPVRGGIGHTASCIDGCRYAYLAGSPDGIEIVDLRDPRRPRFAGRFAAREAGDTHDVQVDAQGLAWIAGRRGTAAYSTRDPRRPRLVHFAPARARDAMDGALHHNSLRLSAGVLSVVEEALVPGCAGAGALETWAIGARRRLRRLDSWTVEPDARRRVACSAHYHDARDGLVAQGWYEQGVRLLDVRDPRRIEQVGYWIAPGAMVWGALFAPTDPTGETVYVLDHVRGIDILRVDRAASPPVRRLPRRRATPGRVNVALLLDDGRELVRPGQRLRVTLTAGAVTDRPARDVEAVVALPDAVARPAAPGARFDPVARTLTWRLGTLGRDAFVERRFEVRVRRDARPGALELVGRARAPGDALALDDRWVDRDAIVGGRPRAAPPGARSALLCRLGLSGARSPGR